MTKEHKTPKERDTMDLFELVCQLSARATIHQTREVHEALMEAKDEMAQRLASAPVRCGWVKASTRLPAFEKQVYIKDNVGCKRLGNFFENDFGVETLYICPNGAHESFYIQAKDFWSIEWLDEPEGTLPTVEECMEWAKNNECFVSSRLEAVKELIHFCQSIKK